MWNNQSVEIIFPAYNEEENIYNAINEFLDNEYVDSIIVVDNNSKDNTKEEILKTSAKYIYEELPGYGSALKRGLIESKADIIITCEPDGTFVAKDLIRLLIYSNEHDVVFGTRTSKACIWNGANMAWHLRLGNVVVGKLLEYLFNGPCLTDVGCTYKLIKKDILNKIKNNLTVKKSHFQPEFMINCIIYCKNVVEIPVNYLERKGQSKITGKLDKAIKLGIIMIIFILKNKFLKTIKIKYT